VHRIHRLENMLDFQPGRVLFLEFMRQYIEQHFGIRAGIQVTAVTVEKLLGEFPGINQVAIMSECDSVR